MLSRHDIENRFMYHPLGDDAERAANHEHVRSVVKDAAHRLNARLPDCPERNRCIDELDSALMWANAAIARQR